LHQFSNSIRLGEVCRKAQAPRARLEVADEGGGLSMLVGN
jgi:hypothetical protein